MNNRDSMTVRQALRSASDALQAVTDESSLEASLLLAHCLSQPRSWLMAHDDHRLDTHTQDTFHTLCRRRHNGEPLAYIMGEKEFWSLNLKVTPDVLIPRPDTECLVEVALEHLPSDRSVRVVDLGTGSGAIALALASERPLAMVWATDISDEALSIARQNAAQHGLNISFCKGRWLDAVMGQAFDMIVSNPPYIRANDPHLAALSHEPVRALTSGENGMDDLKQIIQGSQPFLYGGGWLIVEHGMDQGSAVREVFDAAGYIEISTRQDLGQRDRVTLGQKP